MNVERSVAQSKVATVGVRRLALTVAKGAISAVLIYWILRGTNPGEILAAVRFANIPVLMVAFSLHFVGYYVSALRWRVLLRAQGGEASIPFLVKSYMVSMFVGNFLPSTLGGDAVRAYDSWRVGRSKAGAVAVILVDRLLGTLVLMFFALGSLLLWRNPATQSPLLYLLLVLGLGGMLAIVWMIFMPSRGVIAFIERIRVPFSRKIVRLLEKVVGAFLAFRGRSDALSKALRLSLILQANVVLHYFLIAKALDLGVPFVSFFTIIPLALFIMMIPVSINAIGIRESAFVFFFSVFGVSRAEAVAFSWLAYSMVLVQGVLGGLVYVCRENKG